MKRSLMETRAGKSILWGCVALACALAIGIALFGFRLWRAMRSEEPPSVVQEMQILPPGEPDLGSVFRAEAVLRAPWGRSPRSATVVPGEGVQLASEPKWSRAGWTWGYADWRLTVPLQGYRAGKSGTGTVEASFPNGSLTLSLPAATIAEPPVPDSEELLLAPEIIPTAGTGSRALSWMLFGIGVLILLAILAFLLLRKRRCDTRPEPPVWERTLEKIRNLLVRVKSGECSTERAVSELTDIVRRYLETRFQLRATRQTTTEFLRAIGRDDRILSVEDRKFLRSFLESADMVKFARLPAEPDLLENAAHHAESLVLASVSRDEEKEGGAS